MGPSSGEGRDGRRERGSESSCERWVRPKAAAKSVDRSPTNYPPCSDAVPPYRSWIIRPCSSDCLTISAFWLSLLLVSCRVEDVCKERQWLERRPR